MYCESTSSYKRVRTKAVTIGKLTIGDLNPIRIQSMTTSNTENIQMTVEQILELEKVGCEIVRVTAPSRNSADALEKIVNKLRQKKSNIPIVADIHFTPNAALRASEFVEKIRINPGNYAVLKKRLVYTELNYKNELEYLEEKFIPLIDKLKRYKRAMRIGVNHGSLSERIMNRYGDSPIGMLESAWEFAEICVKNDFHNFVFSMKSSNPQVMIQAYRLLQERMYKRNFIYPLHLGVTEAGDGDDGRIKSFVGIGTLLDDGLGDTIRVSLTESPVKEIPVAKELADFYNRKLSEPSSVIINENRNPFKYEKRETITIKTIGGMQQPLVILEQNKTFSHLNYNELNAVKYVDQKSSVTSDKFLLNICSVEDLDLLHKLIKSRFFVLDSIILRFKEIKLISLLKVTPFALFFPFQGSLPKILLNHTIVLEINPKDIDKISEKMTPKNVVLTIKNGNIYNYRQLLSKISKNPILISSTDESILESSYIREFSILAGSLFCDGIGNGLILSSKISIPQQLKTAFTILQATRQRITKTDYISCPSCGRTLFDLEKTSTIIKQHTSHLKGLKIAIMGCIVNGPGEMADADFGYVGAGINKINLYVGKNLVQRNIKSENALAELIELIKKNKMWIEP